LHGENKVKIIGAQQAKVAHNYKNIKEKLCKTNSAIWFNKTCRLEQLQPNYIHININGCSKQCYSTKKAAIQFRLTQEIKFLYKKKTFLNTQLYKAHLECANYWNSLWPTVQLSLNEIIPSSNEARYNKLKKKLEHLHVTQNKQYTRQQDNTTSNPFYARVKNLFNVKFSKEEINILETGHNYALEAQPKHYLRDPIIDTENAIQQLDSKLHNVYRFMASKEIAQISSSVTVNYTHKRKLYITK
jgi:hypothetical protein